MKTLQFENTSKLFDKIREMSFWQRIFSWKTVVSLTLDSYNEFKSVDKELQSWHDKYHKLNEETQAIKSDLKHAEDSKTKLQNDVDKLREEIKHNNNEIQKKEKELGKLKESEDKNKDRITALEKDLEILEAKRDDLIEKNTKNEKKITEFEKLEKKKQEEYEHKVTELNAVIDRLDKEKIRLQQEREQEIRENFEKMKETWKNHESIVEQAIKVTCNKYQIEYIDGAKVPFKGNPDNTLKICGEYIIFDAKSPSSDDLDNFPNYLKTQAESVKKYIKEKDVKKDIFLVIPSNTFNVVKQFCYNMADYNVYLIAVDSLEPIMLSLRKIEDYEFADKLSPEDRDNICRVIGKFAHMTKRRIQVDNFFSHEFINLLVKCGNLPEDILNKAIEFEKSDKLNPPMQKRAKLISNKELKKETLKVKQMAEIEEINTDVDAKKIEQIPLYKNKK